MAIGNLYAQTDGSFTGERRGGQFLGNGTAATTSLITTTSIRRHCTVNVAMTNGIVSRINYSGPTGGILTAGEQCAFAIQNCVQ